MRQGPPKKPKMSRERYNELDAAITAAGTNTVIPESEWTDFWVAQRYYRYRPTIVVGPGYIGQ